MIKKIMVILVLVIFVSRLGYTDIEEGGTLVTLVNSNEGIYSEDIKILIKTVPIEFVHKMAIDYAEVNPEKISKWRDKARWKALLPKVSLDFSESIDENVEIYKNATTSYIVTGPNEMGADWGVDLSWDLSDLVWNDVQTSIDVRSRLMVRLREDILEEVTRIYFERKRTIFKLENNSENDETFQEKIIRIEESNAYLDAYTGGGFTRELLLSRHSEER